MKKQKGFVKILLIIIAIIAIAVFVYIRMGSRTDIIPSNITDNKTSSSLQNSDKDITAVQPSITFISPNSKSHYALGGIMTIKWEIKNLAKSMTGTGFLLCNEEDYSNHSKCGELLGGNESTNQLEWKIQKSKYNYGANPSIPGKYKIISEIYYGSDKSILYGSSEEFTIESSSSATADWKTYKNDQYKFEFKYPSFYGEPHIFIKQQPPYLLGLNLINNLYLGVYESGYFNQLGSLEKETLWDMGKDIKIGDNVVRKILDKDKFNKEILRYVFKRGDYAVAFTVASVEGDGNWGLDTSTQRFVIDNIPELNQIISTFKFTK